MHGREFGHGYFGHGPMGSGGDLLLFGLSTLFWVGLPLLIGWLAVRASARQSQVGEQRVRVREVARPSAVELVRTLYVRGEIDVLTFEELLGERLGDGATVAKELAEEPADQARDGAAVIDIAWRQAERQQFAAGHRVVDDQVEVEPREPAHRGLAAARIDGKDAMRGDAGRCGRCGRRSGRWSPQS